MREIAERDSDESAERALFARRARVVGDAPPDFASVLAEVARRAADVSERTADRRGRRVAAASMTVACLAAAVAAWVRVGDTSHTIVAEPDAGIIVAPEAVGAANFSPDEPQTCAVDRSVACASDESALCVAPAAPVCSDLSASCESAVTCSLAGP